jgi:transposase
VSRFILSHSTIRRLYDQGLDSIVRLVTKLEDQVQDLTVLHTSNPQRTIMVLSGEIKRLAHTVEQKTRQLTETHQLNHQLQQRIRELEQLIESETVSAIPVEVIKRDSHNSSAPPFLDAPWNKPKRTRSLRKKSNRTVGGQPGHRGTTLRQVGNPDRIIAHLLDACPTCRTSFSGSETIRFSKRQIFDVVNGGLFVTEHQVAATRCPACHVVARASFPANVKAPAQYGGNARSISLYLHLYQLIPVARTAEAMRDLFACPMSPATIQRAARLCSKKLVRCEQRIKARIRDSAVIGVDETGVRIAGAVRWVHVARSETLTHFASHTSRGKAAFDAIGIINQFKGTLVRDGWSSYKWYSQCRHSLCNAHLLRDLTYIGEAEPAHTEWTTQLSKLLIEIKDAVEAAKSSSHTELDSQLQKDFCIRYHQFLTQAEQLVRGSPEQKSNGLTAPKLLNRLVQNKAEILRFMTDFSVPFDNNGAERDLRMLKLQQKIAGCFRTIEGVQTFCRMRSYLSSARKQGRGVLAAIERALKGKPIALTT